MKEREISGGFPKVDCSPARVCVVLKRYEETIATPRVINIGPAVKPTSVYEGETTPLALREYQVNYPRSLIEAYIIACEEYDKRFTELVEGHKIWESDYQYAPFTLAFQVDGPAYSEEFLRHAEFVEPEILAEFIKRRVFEFEANIAAYGLNGRLWPNGTTNETWHTALENVRLRTGKKIAVLAGTEQKLDEMLLCEMGATRDQLPSAEAIRSMTGFDAFLGPNDLQKIYTQYDGKDCPFVFYGRTSRPKSWLRDPNSKIDEGIFARPEILRYVRAHALTHNFDDPILPSNDHSVIMDTKEPLVRIGSAYLVTKPGDIYSSEFMEYLSNNGIDESCIVEGSLTEAKKNKLGCLFFNFPSANLLSRSLTAHLEARGEDPTVIANGDQKMRAKPLKQHYGIYGHEVGPVNRAKFLNELMKQMGLRGEYIVQPEFANLHIIDRADSNVAYIAIDRVFFVRGADGKLQSMESCRSLMPAQSLEGKRNNVHEGPQTRCARIVI